MPLIRAHWVSKSVTWVLKILLRFFLSLNDFIVKNSAVSSKVLTKNLVPVLFFVGFHRAYRANLDWRKFLENNFVFSTPYYRAEFFLFAICRTQNGSMMMIMIRFGDFV